MTQYDDGDTMFYKMIFWLSTEVQKERYYIHLTL